MVKSDLKPEMDGRKVTCKIYGEPVEGILRYENKCYFILNYVHDGAYCKNRGQYPYSWQWDTNVSDFKFVDSIKEVW